MTEKKIEELIQKYADGTASEMEIQQLKDWYRSSAIGDVPWLTTNRQEEQEVHDRMLHRLQKKIIPAQTKVFPLFLLRAAAVFLLVVGAAMALWYRNSSSDYIVLHNPSGKIQQVSLPDGSKIWLNAATTLRYKKAFAEHRDIQLEGEAFFNVTHDAAHPFVINAGGVQTVVLGTSFNIKAYKEDDSTTVSVVTGRVRVVNGNKEFAVLTPSLQLSFDRRQQNIITRNIDTTAVIAWRNGSLIFDGVTFSDIAKSLERWYAVQIFFTNNAMKDCRYYMSFDNDIPLEKLLATMAKLTGMKYKINQQDKTITLSGKACTAVQ